MLQLKAIPKELTFLPDQKVIKAREYSAWADSTEMIAAAHRQASLIIDDAKKAYAAEKKRGFAEGEDEAKQQASERMLETIVRGVDYLAKMEEQVTSLVMLALRRIIGEMDEKELITRIVRHALEVVRNQKQVTVRVSPSQIDAVRAEIDDILKNFSSIHFIDVTADSRLKAGGCILETEIGVVDASLDFQIEAVRKSLSKLLRVSS